MQKYSEEDIVLLAKGLCKTFSAAEEAGINKNKLIEVFNKLRSKPECICTPPEIELPGDDFSDKDIYFIIKYYDNLDFWKNDINITDYFYNLSKNIYINCPHRSKED